MVNKNLNKKQLTEIAFWIEEIEYYKLWYLNKIPYLYYTTAPKQEQRIIADSLCHSAILTWLEMHQKPKYLKDLNLNSYDFSSKNILDLGSGPMPSATSLKEANIYSLDPLHHIYKEIGFPYDLYQNTVSIDAYAEKIPITDHFFDVIISVNAIDHVDDLRLVAKELARVSKPNCIFIMHVHYHSRTICEPIEINDEIFLNLFNWVKDLRVIKRSHSSYSTTISNNEQFVLWSNYH